MNRPINIVLVSLNDKFCRSVASSLAERLDMFNADCHDMLVYDLIDPKAVIEKCGIEYFKKREKGVMENCSEYHNTVLTINFDLYKTHSNCFINSLVLFLRLPEGKQDKVPNSLDFELRDAFLAENSHIIVSMEQKSVKKCVDLIIKKMGEYYENC